MGLKKIWVLVVVGAGLVTAQVVQAHPLDFMVVKTKLKAAGNELSLETEVPFLFDYPSPEYERRLEFLTGYFGANFLVRQEGRPCTLKMDGLQIEEAQPLTRFNGRFSCPAEIAGIGELKIATDLFVDLFFDLNHFVTLEVGDQVQDLLFTPRQTASPVLVSQKNFGAVLKQFLELGIEHILFGLDHILFVVAVHLVVRKFRNIIILVTSFTIAHSLTLILAGLGLITITSRLVEPLIALSIGYMAWRNFAIERRGGITNLRERWLGTFGFGLIHGLGFAAALRAVGIPQNYLLPPLLAFNGGVEIGQLAVVGALFPVLVFLQKRGKISFVVYGVSGIIAIISLIWFVQRILG